MYNYSFIHVIIFLNFELGFIPQKSLCIELGRLCKQSLLKHGRNGQAFHRRYVGCGLRENLRYLTLTFKLLVFIIAYMFLFNYII